MKLSHLVFLLLLAKIVKNLYQADVFYFDDIGEPHNSQLSYYIDQEKTHFGQTLYITLYQIKQQNCNVEFPSNMLEYFAAFVKVDVECNVDQIVRKLEQQGADLIFLQLDTNRQQFDQNRKIPIFVLDSLSQYQSNFFDFESSQSGTLSLNVKFEIPKEKDVNKNFVKLQIFYIPSSPFSYTYINTISDVYFALEDKIIFEPHVITYSSQTNEIKAKNCISDGLYCTFGGKNDEQEIEGKSIMMETLRQLCIYKQKVSMYFQYINMFQYKCIEDFSQSCSQSIQNELDIDQEGVQQCVVDSFEDGELSNQSDNKIFKVEKQIQQGMQASNFYPVAFVNDYVYNGSLNSDDLFFSLCAQLDENTQECRQPSFIQNRQQL